MKEQRSFIYFPDDYLIASVFLCRVQRAVNRINGSAVRLTGLDNYRAEACRYADGGACKYNLLLLNGFAKPFGKGTQPVFILLDGQNDKFFSAVARQHIMGAQLLCDYLYQRAQNMVSRQMVVGVIDGFEAINVKHQKT